jgi:lipopolysaccharide/colanic/teichoic acid biosynthesis glycosyltransferase
LAHSTSLLEKGVVLRPNDRPPSPADESGDGAVLSVTLSRTAAASLDLFDPLQADAPLAPAGNRTVTFLAVKRAIDFVGAAMLLLVLSPVMLVTYLALFCTTRGRPIFVQERVGFLGKPFRMYKFRTMVLDAAAQQSGVENHQDGPIFKNFHDPRITPIGRILRSLSIDETPQLLNVLFGQMSLVGPRPGLAEEVREYEPWQRTRLTVKPGLTCLWQVSGRSEIGFDEWMRMDAWYVHHQTLWLDLILLARTPGSVLSRRGAF